MSFSTTAYYRNLQLLPQPQPAPLQNLFQVPPQNDFGTATSGILTAGNMIVGALYFNPTAASSSFYADWTLPSGDSMMKTFGKNLNKFCRSGTIVSLDVVNYGSVPLQISSGAGGSQNKMFTGGDGTGICSCLNIKFTSSTGSYIVF